MTDREAVFAAVAPDGLPDCQPIREAMVVEQAYPLNPLRSSDHERAGKETTVPTTTTAKVALVTGASSGIGADTALRLKDAGYTVYGAARRTERMIFAASPDLQAAIL